MERTDILDYVKRESMLIHEALTAAAKRLQPKRITCAADKSLGRLEAEILLAHTLKKDRVWLLAHSRDSLRTTAGRLFSGLVARRVKHEPIAYILGKKEFYGRHFKVTRDVLIPRPETELMIEHILEARHDAPLIWDVGTGSGAVGVTLALTLPKANVIASDVSASALKIAKQNAKSLGAKRIRFFKASLLDEKIKKTIASETKNYSTLIVAANLPYLPVSDKKKLEKDVVKFEPSSALFAGKDGLKLITTFLTHLALALHEWKFKHVSISIEFDPPQTKTLRKLAKHLFPSAKIVIQKDLAGRDRILSIALPTQ